MQHHSQQDIEKDTGWRWFSDKVLPALFIGVAMAVGSVLWANYTAVQQLASKVDQHQRDLDSLKAEVVLIKNAYMTRLEVLETMKRVEQQYTILLLQSGIKIPRNKD